MVNSVDVAPCRKILSNLRSSSSRHTRTTYQVPGITYNTFPKRFADRSASRSTGQCDRRLRSDYLFGLYFSFMDGRSVGRSIDRCWWVGSPKGWSIGFHMPYGIWTNRFLVGSAGCAFFGRSIGRLVGRSIGYIGGAAELRGNTIENRIRYSYIRNGEHAQSLFKYEQQLTSHGHERKLASQGTQG